jgi:hypothetical protein
MQNPPHTIRRNNVLVYRRRFPTEVVSAGTGQFFHVSLKTGDTRLAIRRIHDWNLPKQFQDRVDALFAQNSTQYDQSVPNEPATEAEAVQAVRNHFNPILAQAEIDFSQSLLPDAAEKYSDQISTTLSKIFNLSEEESKSKFSKFISDPEWIRAVAQNTQINNILQPNPIAPNIIDQSISKIILAEAGYRLEARSNAARASANAVGRGLYEFFKLFKARAQSQYDYKITDPLFADYMASGSSPEGAKPNPASDGGNVCRLDQLIAEYRAKKAPKWPRGAADDFDYTMKLATQFFGAQCLLERISVKDCLTFRDALTDLPPNHSKKPEFKGLDIRAAVALAQKQGLPGRAPQTLKKQLGEVCRLFEHAERFQYIKVSPARGLAEDILDDVDPRDKREALPDSDIEKILNSDAITKIIQAGLPIDWSNIGLKEANIFWLLMILTTTGMRLAEADLPPRNRTI